MISTWSCKYSSMMGIKQFILFLNKLARHQWWNQKLSLTKHSKSQTESLLFPYDQSSPQKAYTSHNSSLHESCGVSCSALPAFFLHKWRCFMMFILAQLYLLSRPDDSYWTCGCWKVKRTLTSSDAFSLCLRLVWFSNLVVPRSLSRERNGFAGLGMTGTCLTLTSEITKMSLYVRLTRMTFFSTKFGEVPY